MTDMKKIILMGKPNAGKTTIKQLIFEGMNAQDLIDHPLRPTRGLMTSQYSWFDVNCSVFDTAGQKFYDAFSNKNLKTKIFSGGTYIVFIFDYTGWIDEAQREEIYKDIEQIKDTMKEGRYKSELVLFFHKVDLIAELEYADFIEKVGKELRDKFDVRVFFTSIKSEFLYSLYNAFYELLNEFSEDRGIINEILLEHLKEAKKTVIFVTSEKNSIVAQVKTDDFNLSLLNNSHHLIHGINETLEKMKQNDKIKHFVLQTLDDMSIVFYFLNLLKKDLKNVVLISETLTSNKLIWKAGIISRELYNKV